MQALCDLGVEPAFRSSCLWAFFDYSYRARADPDYLAEHWRKAGIAALHVASWHFYDADPEHDEYLKHLIEACHRHGVLVYAWIELPHVSEKFWNDHPQWREKTAALQDAELDWRKLMNLQNKDSAAAIRDGLKRMMERFDWDGVNLAELYFESLEGSGNPARFTPMNEDVRAEFRAQSGWDPIELWTRQDSISAAPSLRQFLDFRAGLARRMQEDWLATMESFRRFRPDLDIVLTHVDDRFDTGMKDSIGADAARVLPLLDQSFVLVSRSRDPATVWNLGPQRYPEIAKRYQPLTPHTDKLAIDINIVDRYQDVYPTKQQTGVVNSSNWCMLLPRAFPRIALFLKTAFSNPTSRCSPHLRPSLRSIRKTAAGSRLNRPRISRTELGKRGSAGGWQAMAGAIGNRSASASRRPRRGAGGCEEEGISLIDLNAKLRSASVDSAKRMTFEYSSDSRAIARFDRKPSHLEVDGAAYLQTPRFSPCRSGAHR